MKALHLMTGDTLVRANEAFVTVSGSRSRHWTLLANLALALHALLRVLAVKRESQSLPAVLAGLPSRPARGLALLTRS